MIVAGVADDFTGANDCAGRFADAGLEAWTRPSPGFKAEAGASLCSAETRFLGAREARRAMQAAWAGMPGGLGWRFGFQKLDSTLRGHPGEEVLGLIAATGARKVAFCAAYPRHGRQARHGAMTVHGIRLDKSEYFRDPLSPAREWRVEKLFPSGFAAVLGRGGVPGLRARIRASKARVLCFDAVEEADLARAARACLAEGIRFFAGASGLAGALGREIRGPSATRPKLPPLPRERMILAGTLSSAAFTQLEELRRSKAGEWRSMPAPGRALPRLALSSLARRSDLGAERRRAKAAGMPWQHWAERSITRLVRRGLALAGPSSRLWLLTGGHTAIRFFREAGLDHARVFGELLPGLPLLRAEPSKGGRPALLCTRPGGFGGGMAFVDFMRLR